VGICKDVKPITISATEHIVILDGVLLSTISVFRLAQDDGFDAIEDFWSWFKEDFEGVLIYF